MVDVFVFILSCLYFFLPAYVANMAPPLMRRTGLFRFLYKAVDGGGKFMGFPIFGDHKTWLGIISSLVAGTMIAGLQFWLYQFSFFEKVSFLNYEHINILFFGFMMSLGMVFGDLIFSFIKRRINLRPGAPFIPFDQTNYVLGACLILSPLWIFDKDFSNIDLGVWLTLLFLTLFLHIVINRIGYELGLHKAKW
ncbi:hypothetical protein BWK69_00700 [Candidatus Parcubacteria bacterium A4]|nr:MAG: hypothetical protein BWK69_00700 [Candidatus Parcubacteria bacterium A4]